MTGLMVLDNACGSSPEGKQQINDPIRTGNLQTVVPPPCTAVIHKIRTASGIVLEGSFYNNFSFTTFLNEWLLQMKKRMNIVTQSVGLTTEDSVALNINQKCLYHSLVTIVGLPPTEFFGSGFGKTLRLSKWAACRELVIRLYMADLVTPIQFNRIGSNDLLSKTARKKYRAQWSVVKDKFEHFEHVLLLNEVPDWFLYGPYGDNKVDNSLVEKVKTVISNITDVLKKTEDGSNLEMRRKRKAEDELELSTISQTCETVVEGLSALDDETSVYAKRRYLSSSCNTGVSLPVDKVKPSTTNDIGRNEQYESDRTERHVVIKCETSKNIGDSDCKIIDVVNESAIANQPRKEPSDNSSAVGRLPNVYALSPSLEIA